MSHVYQHTYVYQYKLQYISVSLLVSVSVYKDGFRSSEGQVILVYFGNNSVK